MAESRIGAEKLDTRSYVTDDVTARLVIAADAGDSNTVKQLIASGKTSANALDRGKRPLLWLMVRAKSLRGLETLLQNGADPNYISTGDVDGPASGLELATVNEDPAYLHVLLKYGANANLENAIREPMIHLASNNGRWENIKVLITEGKADVNAVEHGQTDAWGGRVVSYYAGLGDFERVHWLLERGALVNDKIRDAPEGFENRIGVMPDVEAIFWLPLNPKASPTVAQNLAWQKKCQALLLAKGFEKPRYNGHYDHLYARSGLPRP